MIKRPQSASRPLTINIFALVLLLFAALNLATALFDLPAQEEALRALGLGLDWNRDWTIVASSAWFTIELIPIVLIWLCASKFARVLVAVVALAKAVMLFGNLPMLYAVPGLLAGNLIALGAIALLFTPSANEWFGQGDRNQRDVFD